jgi:hypothetical protein
MAQRVNNSSNIFTRMADVSEQLTLHSEEFISDTGHLVLAYWNPAGYNGLVNTATALVGSEFWFRIFMVNIYLQTGGDWKIILKRNVGW